jgi:hypothetical protein
MYAHLPQGKCRPNSTQSSKKNLLNNNSRTNVLRRMFRTHFQTQCFEEYVSNKMFSTHFRTKCFEHTFEQNVSNTLSNKMFRTHFRTKCFEHTFEQNVSNKWEFLTLCRSTIRTLGKGSRHPAYRLPWKRATPCWRTPGFRSMRHNLARSKWRNAPAESEPAKEKKKKCFFFAPKILWKHGKYETNAIDLSGVF